MHRSHYSVTPTNSKLLQRRWDEKTFNEHRRKVRSAKPFVDSTAPRTYVHMHCKLKKLQVAEERLATVERDNKILLEKMSYITRSRGLLDNRNDYDHKSLNKTKRQTEMLRLTNENQALLKRIHSTKSHYGRMQQQDEWKVKERYMGSIARYPKDGNKESMQTSKSRTKNSRRSSRETSESEEGKEDHSDADVQDTK